MKEYIFASQESESEYNRLTLIQDSFDEKSQKHLLKAGLCHGMDVLEIGVGAGSLANWMSEIVGEKGSVLGVDLNTDYALDEKSYELIEADVLDLDISKKFDIIHLRYVLIHNLQAQDIITKVYGLLKEGGKFVVEEPDFTLAKWIDAENSDACKRVNSAICKMFEKRGLKAHYGSTAHLNLEEANFKIEESKSYLHLCAGNEDVAKVMRLSALALQEQYISTHICSKEDINVYIQACEDQDSLAVYYATIALIAVKTFPDKKERSVTIEESADKDLEEGVHLAKDETAITRCFSLISTLRPHLKEETFVSDVNEQIEQGYKLFYLYKNNKVLCIAGCKISKNLAWGKHLYIADLVSDTKSRSKGHGKELLDYVIEFAKNEGCKEVHLDSGVQRFKAHKFYLREGFEMTSHHFSYKMEI